MSDPITIVFTGEPVAKGRPRFTKAGVTYTPTRTRDFEKKLAAAAADQFFQRPLQGGLAVKFLAQLPIPKSWPKRKQEAALRGEIIPRQDLDNLQKASFDALNGILWEDDSQIVRCDARKAFGRPMVVVTVEAA